MCYITISLYIPVNLINKELNQKAAPAIFPYLLDIYFKENNFI